MPLDIDFCPIELPGHGQRIGEMAVTHLDTLVPTLQAVLEPLLTIPFAFFGHSTGACIAFEAARVLRAIDGRSATHLFVSGRPAPGRAIGHRSSVRMFPGGHFYLSEVGRALVDEIVRDLCPAETPQAPRLAGAAI